MSQKTINITPDKSLIRKLGSAGYTTIQAVSELVDNSIDARAGDAVSVEISLPPYLGAITVQDNGAGMGLDGLQAALTLARDSGRRPDSLGKFGLGLKTACSTLGKRLVITTTRAGDPSVLVARHDEDKWESGSEADWKAFPYEEYKKQDLSEHGTTIKISGIKVPMYYGLAKSFISHFGQRYYEHIRSGTVVIRINGSPAAAKPAPIEPKSTKRFSITSSNHKIPVELSILKKRSVSGSYGMSLYYKKRLIVSNSDFGIRRHPEISKLTGKIFLDHVPVNFTKTAFLQESDEYVEAEKAFKSSDIVRGMLAELASKKGRLAAAESVWKRLGSRQGVKKMDILRTMGHLEAKRVLSGLSSLEFKERGVQVRVALVSGAKTQSFEFKDGAVSLCIGRDSPVFAAAKNPVYLLSMMVAEARAAAVSGPDMARLVEARNAEWEQSLGAILPAKAARKKREALPQGYGLAAALVPLFDLLGKRYYGKFQFSGLSTLSGYGRYIVGRPIYSLYAERGGGEAICDIIRAENKFGVILSPTKKDIGILVDSSPHRGLIAVREYAGRELAGAVAPPAKAWMDLYREVAQYGIRYSLDESFSILESLARSGKVSRRRLEAIAQRRNALGSLSEAFDEVFADK